MHSVDRIKRILALLLSATLVITSTSAAFADELPVEEDMVLPVFDTAEEDIYSSVENIEDGDNWNGVPADWDINSSPANWNTSRWMISANYPETDTVVRPVSKDPTRGGIIFSPFSYFFTEESPGEVVDIVDGKVILSDPKVRHKEAADYFYRAVDAGGGYFVLVRYNVLDGSAISIRPHDGKAEYFDFTYRQTGKANVEQRCSNYYSVNGELQPIVQYTNRKKVWVDMMKGKSAKPNEDQAIFVDAVLVQHTGNKTNFVSWLPIKSVKAVNNIYATLSSDNLVVANGPNNDDYSTNDLGWTRNRKENENDKYTGFKSQPLLSSTENIFLKGDSQPYFTIKVGVAKDAPAEVKQLLGAANKALAAEQFKFQIARYNLGTTDNDRVPASVYYVGPVVVQANETNNTDKVKAATDALKSLIESKTGAFRSTYSDYAKYMVGDYESVEAAISSNELLGWERITNANGQLMALRPYGRVFIAEDKRLPMYRDTNLDNDIIISNHLVINGVNLNVSHGNDCPYNGYFRNMFDTSNSKKRTTLTEKNGVLKLKLNYRKVNVTIGKGKTISEMVVSLLKLLVTANTDFTLGSEDEAADLDTDATNNYKNPASYDMARMLAEIKNILMYGLGGFNDSGLHENVDAMKHAMEGGGIMGLVMGFYYDEKATNGLIDYLESDEGVALTTTVAQDIISVMLQNGVPEELIKKVVKFNVGYTKVKVGTSEGGKVDVIMSQMDAAYPSSIDSDDMSLMAKDTNTGSGGSSYHFMLLKGVNNMEGAATMRLGTDGKTIFLGNYKDDKHYFVDETE